MIRMKTSDTTIPVPFCSWALGTTAIARAVLVAALFAPDAGRAADNAATAPAGVTYRNIVRKQLPNEAKVIGLEYTVMTVDKNGSEKAVDPESHPFHVGDSFLVKIKPQDDLYVYVFTEGPTGDKSCLLPTESESPVLVRGESEISLPDDGGWFEFQPPAGEEKLVVIAVKEPNTKLNLLAAAAFRESGKRLTVAEEAEKRQVEAEVTAVRERGTKGVRTRGPVKKNLGTLTTDFDQQAGDATVIVPPDADKPSTEVVRRLGEKSAPAELIIDIPLRSRLSASGN